MLSLTFFEFGKIGDSVYSWAIIFSFAEFAAVTPLAWIYLNYLNMLVHNNSKLGLSFDIFLLLEEDLGSLEDILLFLALFFVTLVTFILGGSSIITSTYEFLINISILLLLGTLITLSVIYTCGLNWSQVIRGASYSPYLIYSSLLDLVSIIIISLRFIVQNIRIVFLLIAYIELFEYVSDELATSSFLNLTNGHIDLYILVDFIKHIFLFLYYVGHLYVLYVAQLIAYISLSFWLFFFLYSNFSKNIENVKTVA